LAFENPLALTGVLISCHMGSERSRRGFEKLSQWFEKLAAGVLKKLSPRFSSGFEKLLQEL
jgi:hypothetical protein